MPPGYAADGKFFLPPGRAAFIRRLGLFDATMIVMGGIIGSHFH